MHKKILKDISNDLEWFKKHGFIGVYEDTEDKLNNFRGGLRVGRIKAERFMKDLGIEEIHGIKPNVKLKSVTINGKKFKV